MAITDLLSRIPIPPLLRRGAADRAGTGSPAPDGSWMADAWSGYSAPAAWAPGRPAARSAAAHLPAWAILALGSLALACLSLLALLLLNDRLEAEVATPGPIGSTLPVVADSAPIVAGGAPSQAAEPPAALATTFGTDPVSIPAEVLARLEAASNEPLRGELTELLTAVQVGFGSDSAQLDPALRSYATRMASRFEWNPDTFRVAVAAPAPALADARASTLRRLFGDAVASERLVIRTVTGPGALTLASR